jgi:hypothetical protein
LRSRRPVCLEWSHLRLSPAGARVVYGEDDAVAAAGEKWACCTPTPEQTTAASCCAPAA